MKYYVYEWFVKDTGEIFYVGKGSNLRYKTVDKNRNDLFKKKILENECDSRIIKYFDNELDAYLYEADRIKELRSEGMCSCNIMPGGAGGLGEYWTDELRQKYSENNVMKRPEQRKRMSVKNPMKDPEIAKIVGEKHARAVIINGIRYRTIRDAANHFGVATSTITDWCNKGGSPHGDIARFEDSEQKEYVAPNLQKIFGRQMIYGNHTYDSVTQASKILDISVDKLYRWLKKGVDVDGNPCRYVNDDSNIEFNHQKNKLFLS